MKEISFVKLREKILSKEMSFHQLLEYSDEVGIAFNNLEALSDLELENLIYLCLDTYIYEEDGNVLMTDHQYDLMMNEWIDRGNERIIYPDAFVDGNSWDMIKHEDPGTVGSLDKIYEEDELISWLTRVPIKDFYRDMKCVSNQYIIAPKFDGISGSIRVDDGKITYAATRRDGNYGQNITEVVKKMKNNNSFITAFERQYLNLYGEDVTLRDGFYKVEFVMSTEDYNILKEDKPYANRRSAVSGIVNTPNNRKYGKYITILPLLYRAHNNTNKLYYAPQYSTFLGTVNYSTVLDEVEESMTKFRMPSFPYRVDGVVIFEVDSDRFNPSDYMECGIAFKANTAETPTRIKFLYMSIGRLGKATPMARIEPTDVNETIVEDASLGSYQKYLSLHLHEDELVTAFSAGDVIPQLRPMNPPVYPKGAKPLEIALVCPHCDHDLEPVGKEFACVNPECPRIISGRIANFMAKIGAKNISDATIFALYDYGAARDIKELFTQAIDKMRQWRIKGWGDVSLTNLETELHRLQTTPIELSRFIGAMGIKGIAKKKARAVFRELDLKFFLKADKEKMKYYLLGVEGFAGKTAEVFSEWMMKNRHELQELMKLFNIVEDKPYKGSVVFTGFRDDELAEEFDELGYEVVDNVTSNTIAVINASTKNTSTKCKSAIAKGIDIVYRGDVEEVLTALKRRQLLSR